VTNPYCTVKEYRHTLGSIPVQTWGRVIILALLAWTISITLWAFGSWIDTVPLKTPPGVEAQTLKFK
jgi:hypothetical protein